MFQTWQYQKEGYPTLAKVKGEAIWAQNQCKLHIVQTVVFHLGHIEFAQIVVFIKGVNF